VTSNVGTVINAVVVVVVDDDDDELRTLTPPLGCVTTIPLISQSGRVQHHRTFAPPPPGQLLSHSPKTTITDVCPRLRSGVRIITGLG